MANKKEESFAQLVDRFLKRIAMAVSVMSVAYGSAAAAHFVSEGAAYYLELAKTVLALTAAAMVLPIMISFMVRRKKYKGCEGESAGYIAEIYGKSAGNAFATGFIFAIMLEPLSEHILAGLPPAFFVQATISVMIGALGISFFVLSRDGDDDFDDEFEDEEEAGGQSA